MSRTLSVQSPAIPFVLGCPALEPVRLSGHEGLNSLFAYELLLKTPDGLNLGASGAADFDLDAFIGRELSCEIELEGSPPRQINTLITDAAMWGEEGRHVQYKLTLRPWLHLATLRTDCRIFQDQTVVEILDELLAGYAFPVDKRLFETYPTRDYQTQFNESDFAFFSRLCQEWGISYHFEHSQGKHRLVLCDAMAAYGQADSAAYREVEYHAPGWKLDAEYIHSFVPASRLASGRYATSDYDYSRPRANLSAGRKDPRPTGQADGEVYQWHSQAGGSHCAQPQAGSGGAGAGGGGGGANNPQEESRHLTLLRMQALRTHGNRAQASGNLRAMVPGCTFRLARHPREKANTEYLVLDTRFLIEDIGENSQTKEASDRKQQWRVEVDFTAHPITEPLRPALTQPKPVCEGPQIALVVGPEGQNLWTDAYGRIKVQFPWDRRGRNNQHSTCWLRVSSPWAGNQLGGMHLPRIGQEVIVSFIGGDPDLPLCSGRVHNQNNRPSWALPDESALSGFRSRELTSEGGNAAMGRSNHLILDDTEGRIQAQLRSDHRHSQLSLGSITRIEDNAGRKDPRGEGFELRTDGHGVVRARDGLLISSEARGNAANHAKDMGETVARLKAAQDQHDALAEAAQVHKAQDKGVDQDEVQQALAAQNDAIQGRGGPFPELDEPHVVLASPAGIEASTPASIHFHTGKHAAFTSQGHTSLSAARRWLASAADGIRAFTHKKGIQLIASEAPIELQAHKDELVLIAHEDLVMKSIEGQLHITAKKKVVIIGGGSYTEWSAQGITHGTAGTWQEHAALHAQVGPMSLDALYPVLSETVMTDRQSLLEEHFVLVEHASGLRLPQQKYRISFQGGRTIEGKTNDQGETQVVQSTVHQIASVEVLRNAEDGLLASYTPFVRTPAEQTYQGLDVTAQKRAQLVGNRRFAVNADKATSSDKAPTHTSCDPNNWGMRKSEPGSGDATRWDYPVASEYVKGIKKALTALEWAKATWPLDDTDSKRLLADLKTSIEGALARTAFALPSEGVPTILVPTDAGARQLGLNPEDKDLKGLMRANDWLLIATKAGVMSIINAARRSDTELQDPLCAFASTLYHEARHAQQFFWVLATMQQFPADYDDLPNIRRFWKAVVPARIFQLAAVTPVPDEPSARAGLKRMVVGMYYWQLSRADAANKRNPDKPAYLADVLPTEIPLARKAAYDLLQNVGLGGLSIDVDAMAKADAGSAGYRMQPWEEDSFVCEEVVKRLWRGDSGNFLPTPGFCTAALEYGVKFRNSAARGETGNANRE